MYDCPLVRPVILTEEDDAVRGVDASIVKLAAPADVNEYPVLLGMPLAGLSTGAVHDTVAYVLKGVGLGVMVGARGAILGREVVCTFCNEEYNFGFGEILLVE